MAEHSIGEHTSATEHHDAEVIRGTPPEKRIPPIPGMFAIGALVTQNIPPPPIWEVVGYHLSDDKMTFTYLVQRRDADGVHSHYFTHEQLKEVS